MTHDHEEPSLRPDRVIILDADNPMVEIHGRFVWEDEHERVVAETADRAYRDGFEAGRTASAGSIKVHFRRRRGALDYARLCVIAFLLLLTVLMIPVIFF